MLLSCSLHRLHLWRILLLLLVLIAAEGVVEVVDMDVTLSHHVHIANAQIILLSIVG